MLLRLVDLGMTNTFALLRLLPMSDRDKDTEILALHHQITILERQLGDARPRFSPADRAFLAALLHRFPTVTLNGRVARYSMTARPRSGGGTSALAGGWVTSGDWAAVIVAIAALLVATLAVPARAPRRRAVFTTSGVLVLIALAIGVVTLVISVAGDGKIGGTSRPGTTTSTGPVQSEVSTDRVPVKPTITIDKTAYLDRPVYQVVGELLGYDLHPDVRTPEGDAPPNGERCLVTDLEPVGTVAVGSRVTVTCVPT